MVQTLYLECPFQLDLIKGCVPCAHSFEGKSSNFLWPNEIANELLWGSSVKIKGDSKLLASHDSSQFGPMTFVFTSCVEKVGFMLNIDKWTKNVSLFK